MLGPSLVGVSVGARDEELASSGSEREERNTQYTYASSNLVHVQVYAKEGKTG